MELEGEGDWKEEVIGGGSFKQVSLEDGVNGWASPPGDLFHIRGVNYWSKKQKLPASKEYLMRPLGADWLRSSTRIDHVLAHPENRVLPALSRAHSQGKNLKSSVLAVNLQVPGREHYSAVFYYITDGPVPSDSLLYQFLHGEDDGFRDGRFKLLNRIVKGPWIVRTTLGNHAACLLGRVLTCRYIRGPHYLEIDVDIGSSALASAISHLALSYTSSISVDMAFLIEAQAENELPERVLGAIRVLQIDLASASPIQPAPTPEENPPPTTPGSGPVRGSSWKKLSRGLSLFGHPGKSFKVEAAKEDHHRNG